MKIDPNDPRLTAYALGELDEAEQGAIERELIAFRCCHDKRWKRFEQQRNS